MLVLVETISQFRIRYLVETHDEHPEHALDSVAIGMFEDKEIKEFSQHHLGEVVINHRSVTEEEALELYRKDNSYLSKWDDNKIKDISFNLAGDASE